MIATILYKHILWMLLGVNAILGGEGVHVQTLPKAKRIQGLNVHIKETSLLVHLVCNHLVQCTMFPILNMNNLVTYCFSQNFKSAL